MGLYLECKGLITFIAWFIELLAIVRAELNADNVFGSIELQGSVGGFTKLWGGVFSLNVQSCVVAVADPTIISTLLALAKSIRVDVAAAFPMVSELGTLITLGLVAIFVLTASALACANGAGSSILAKPIRRTLVGDACFKISI